jgi:putative drug exporter of the RND superfamily
VSSLTRWVLSHKRTVVISWLLLTVVGIAVSGPATDALTPGYSVPGREGWETNEAITARYGGTGGMTAPLVPVVTLPRGTTVDSAGVRSELALVDNRLRKALPGSRIASFASTGDRTFVSKDGRTTFALAYPAPDPNSQWGEAPQAAKEASRALEGLSVAGAPVRLTGIDALMEDSGADNQGTSVLVEALIGAFGALLVLSFVFASFLALVPLLMAFVAIMTSFVPLLLLAETTEVSPVVQFLIVLIGLGVAIDYSLLVVTRWREERSHGASREAAIQKAMETAGKAVVFSGITVAIGLLALIALPIPFLRSIGYAGMLIPLVSVAVAITLLPIVVAKLGARLDWPHRRTDARASRLWTRWAEGVARRRWLAAGAGLAVLAALIIAAADIRLGIHDADTLATSGDAKQALVALEDAGIGEGALLPHEILIEGDTDPSRVAERLRTLDGIQGAVAPDAPGWRRDGTALVDVVPIADSGREEGESVLASVRDTAHAMGPDVRVGGQPASTDDFIDAVYGSFPVMIALITLTTFVLLARAFRSLLLPAKAIALNVLSVAAGWGALVLIWQKGYGSDLIWGIESTGSIPSWIPVIAFAFLYGLSMDYEVFILSRMREEYDRTGSTETAVVRGIGRTGRLVTSAALILFLAFVTLASGPGSELKMMASALAIGIFLDATVIRALIVPAVIALMGRWNWWLPRWPARMLRVEPSLPPRAAVARARRHAG